MSPFDNVARKIGVVAMVIGATFLTGTMLMVMTNIISRRFGFVVLGVYELVELLMVVVVAGAVGYTELNKGHVTVSLIKDFLSKRTNQIIERFIHFIHLITWGAVLCSAVLIMVERWSIEVSDVLELPVFPFRAVWTYGLIFWCLVILMDFIKSWKKEETK
ncbi:TRAP transporter small permease subunit [Thermodesulfobacteriota bacterium]